MICHSETKQIDVTQTISSAQAANIMGIPWVNKGCIERAKEEQMGGEEGVKWSIEMPS